jgi:hypothetical protein
VKATAWNPAEFDYWYRKAPLETRIRAWEDLTSPNRKLYRELDYFRRFSKTAGIQYERESELTLDPNSASPPPPDLICIGEQSALYFEMAEVVDEGVAIEVARAERQHRGIYGGPVDIWRPLLRIFSRKLRKRYDPQAVRLDLVLYYGVGRQASFWPFLAADLSNRREWLQRRVDRGPFSAVWLYDTHADRVLARFGKRQKAFIRQFTI